MSANLTTVAKASGRKLTLILITDLEKERQPWMADVILKSGLLGTHDTITTMWEPRDRDYDVKILGGVTLKTKSQPTVKTESASTSTTSDAELSTAGNGESKSQPTVKTESASSDSSTAREGGTGLSTAGASEEEKRATDPSLGQMFQYLFTPGKAFAKAERTEGDEEEAGKVNVVANTRQLADQLERMEILNRMQELQHAERRRHQEDEHAQLLRAAEIANVRNGPERSSANKAYNGLYGLRDNDLVESLINAECDKHKVWVHPVSGKEETQAQREVRMILYDMIVTSLKNFKSMYSGEHVGDNYKILRNVMKLGAPSSMRMKIELTKKLGNYNKRQEQGYQEYELGLQHLSNDLCTVGTTLSQSELTLRLIAGMTCDKRYDKECRDVSEREESYSACHSVFVQKAQALGNLSSSSKKKDEANAAASGSTGKGKGGKGNGSGNGGKGGGRGGKGGSNSTSGYDKNTKDLCRNFLAGKECTWGDECKFEHVTQKQLDAREKNKKKKAKKKSKKDDACDSDGSDKKETAEQKAKRRKKLPCFAWDKTGSCPEGKKCPYKHEAAKADDSGSDS